MEAAVCWSPHASTGSPQFIVVDGANSSLTLSQVDSLTTEKLGGRIVYHSVARITRPRSLTALDWSPADANLFALSSTGGELDLLDLAGRNGIDRSPGEVVACFKHKQQRRCTSLAFNSTGWLAQGLQRVRNDLCLFVYDASRASSASSPATAPLRKLCPAQTVSSVRFFPSSPQECVLGAQAQDIRLYDLRDESSKSQGLASAGTRNVSHIAIDPMDERYFASTGSTAEPNVSIWDRRWLCSPALRGPAQHTSSTNLELRPAVDNTERTTVWNIRYSGVRRGQLGLCSSRGELKIIGLSTSVTSDAAAGVNASSVPDASSTYVRFTKVLEPHLPDRSSKSATWQNRIVAFDWAHWGNGSSSSQPILALRHNKEINVLSVPFARLGLDLSSEQKVLMSVLSPSVSKAEQSSTTAEVLQEDLPVVRPSSNSSNHGMNSQDRLATPRNVVATSEEGIQQNRAKQGYLLDCAKNISIIASSTDSPHSRSQLGHLWSIVARLSALAMNGGMIHRASGWDLSYTGVAALWSEAVGEGLERRLTVTQPGPTTELSRTLTSQLVLSDAIVGLNTAMSLPAFEGERTTFPEHRQLCLAVCGWKFSMGDLEAECEELIEEKRYYQAIVQAVLHDQRHLALNFLRSLIRGKMIPNIGLGPLIAADELNEDQSEMCQWMLADVATHRDSEDSALKALLTYLSSGDWRDVMKTPYLHLGYRIALGLKYLNDTELSGFIQSETARGVRKGDLEGVLLTGLEGQSCMDLLQTYITRTGDIQSAVLATAFTHPLYAYTTEDTATAFEHNSLDENGRWQAWKETYFAQLQAWQCFVPRSKFIVQHRRLAQTRTGRNLVEPPPAQVSLRCLHCQNALGVSFTSANSKGSLSSPAESKNQETPPRSGKTCTQCGRHLPRCGICSLWLGTARGNSVTSLSPSRSGGVSSRSRHDGTKNTYALTKDEGVNRIMGNLLTFCTRCGHGFHADHARSWFKERGHEICPVPDCQCLCGLG